MSKYRILCIELGEYLYTVNGETLYSSLELPTYKETSFKVYETAYRKEAERFFKPMRTSPFNAIKISYDSSYLDDGFAYISRYPKLFEIIEVPDE